MVLYIYRDSKYGSGLVSWLVGWLVGRHLPIPVGDAM
jgi:hypothetical protein